MFELLCNIFLWLGLLYAYSFKVLEAPVPDRVARNPYTLKPDVWPRAIIALLLISFVPAISLWLPQLTGAL